jgi:hypothetical protein
VAEAARRMRAALISTALAAAGLVHLLPAFGLLGSEALARLYGLRIEEPGLLLLMRHRALLFGLLGGALLAASLRPAWQGPALLAALVAVGGFLLLAGAPSALAPALQRVFWIDAGLFGLLLLAALAYRLR